MPSLVPHAGPELPTARSSEPLVSVVTPVHNGADYLADCIRSVLAQCWQAWEYVIVNNASTDRSLEIAESFAAQDSRIRVVNTERLLPQIANHNFALRQISPASRYCKMVFADDWIYPNCLEEMVKLAEADSEIAIVSAYFLKNRRVEGYGLPCDVPDRTASVVAGRDVCRLYLLEGYYVLGSSNSVLYRADLVRARDPFFPESKYVGYFGDSQLCFEVLERSKVGFIHQVLSYTRWGNDSVTSTVWQSNTYDLMRYMFLVKFGTRYLTDSEYRRILTQVENDYYAKLALSLFKRRGPRYWQFHGQGLDVVNIRLDWGRLARMQLPRFLNLLANPKMAMEGLWNRIRSMNLLKKTAHPT